MHAGWLSVTLLKGSKDMHGMNKDMQAGGTLPGVRTASLLGPLSREEQERDMTTELLPESSLIRATGVTRVCLVVGWLQFHSTSLTYASRVKSLHETSRDTGK
jgi:hypothetical protein